MKRTADSFASVDEHGGARTIVADATTGTGPLLWRPEGIEIDPEGPRSGGLSGPLANDRSRYGRALGGCRPRVGTRRGVTVDAERQIAFVTDDAYDAVIAIDLRTGNRQVIAK